MTPQDATEVVPYLTSAATIVALQKWLKTRAVYGRFVDAFPGTDAYAHWIVAGVASFVCALGIHVTWNWTAIAGGQVIFGIPDLQSLAHGLADFWKVYILQHAVYESQHRPPYQDIPTVRFKVPPTTNVHT